MTDIIDRLKQSLEGHVHFPSERQVQTDAIEEIAMLRSSLSEITSLMQWYREMANDAAALGVFDFCDHGVPPDDDGSTAGCMNATLGHLCPEHLMERDKERG